VEGSVRKADGRVRVTAQLVDGRTGMHLWADRYDRPLTDLFALQDDLTFAIVHALRLNLPPEERGAIEQRGTHHPEAYELYLIARRYYLADEQAGELRQVEAMQRLCGRAVNLDPKFAQAWALMAVAQSALHFVHNQPGDGGWQAIQNALSLDPTVAEAHAIHARHLLQAGDLDGAQAALEQALRLDAESGVVQAQAGRLAYVRRDFSKAIEHFERAAALGHAWPGESGLLLSSYHALGDEVGMRAHALKVLARAEQTLAQDHVNLTSAGCAVGALIALGKADRAKAFIERTLLIDPDNLRMRYNFACGMSSFLGDTDTAIGLLQPVFERMSAGWLRHASRDPDLDAIRGDPRFEAMFAEAARRLGDDPRQQ
jgi:adenylate cyclase